MKKNKWLWGGLAGVAILVTVALINYWPVFYILLVPPHKTDKFESWQTNNSRLQIRVEAFHECCAFVPGAYYTFSSAPINSDDWLEITTFRDDDPIPIRQDQVQFVSDDIAFVYMGWVFAATEDAGKNWTVWNACDQAAALKICNYEGIKSVDLSKSGTGSMTVNPIPDQSPLPVLHTNDFGRTWHE